MEQVQWSFCRFTTFSIYIYIFFFLSWKGYFLLFSLSLSPSLHHRAWCMLLHQYAHWVQSHFDVQPHDFTVHPGGTDQIYRYVEARLMWRFRVSFHFFIRVSQLRDNIKPRAHALYEWWYKSLKIQSFGRFVTITFYKWVLRQQKRAWKLFNSFYCCAFVASEPAYKREWPWESAWAWVQNKVTILIFVINEYKSLCHSLWVIFNLVDQG